MLFLCQNKGRTRAQFLLKHLSYRDSVFWIEKTKQTTTKTPNKQTKKPTTKGRKPPTQQSNIKPPVKAIKTLILYYQPVSIM